MKGTKNIRVFALICVLFGGMGQGIVAPKLPELLRGSHALAFDSGFSAALMYLGIFVSTFRYGKWADLGKTHRLLSFGLFGYALSLIALGFSAEVWQLFVARFFEGLALSAIFVAADYILGRLSLPKERGRWLSYYGVALSIGLLLGPILSLVFTKTAIEMGVSDLNSRSPLPSLLFVATLVLLLGFLALSTRVGQVALDSAEKPRLNRAALWGGWAYGFLEAGLVAVFPVLAITEFKVIPEYLLIAVIVVAAISSLLWGAWSDRHGPKSVMRILLLLLILGPMLLSALHFVFAIQGLAFISALLFGILSGGMYPVGFAWLLEALPESNYGYASGAFARAYGLGSLFGPLCVGLGAQAAGARGLYWALSLAGILAISNCPLKLRNKFN